MSEQELDSIYHNYRLALAKLRLISVLNKRIYADFPKNIPSIIVNEFLDKIKDVDNFKAANPNSEISLVSGSEVVSFGNSSTIVFNYEKEQPLHDSEQIILQQEWITHCSYLEAFFQDIYRYIFLKDKQLLSNKDLNLSYEEIISSNSYDEIIAKIIELKLSTSGYDKAYKIISRLNNPPFSYKIRINKIQLEYLKNIISIRNIIIHNNSKTNKEVKDRLIDESLVINETYPLDLGKNFYLHEFITWVIFQVYSALKVKYYNSNYDNLLAQYNIPKDKFNNMKSASKMLY